MTAKTHFRFSRSAGGLLILILSCAGMHVQAVAGDGGKQFPEIEGVYELRVPGEGPVTMQVYFKDGALRTLEAGKYESSKWLPLPDRELGFSRTSKKWGTFQLNFMADEKGRPRRFRMLNEAVKLDATAEKKSELNDAAADPASPSDCLGYLERHYRKAEYQVPMRDGVKLFTQVYSPLDENESHPLMILRTPYGNPPYGEDFRSYIVPSLYFARENYILVFQDSRGMGRSEGKFMFVAPYIKDKGAASIVDESSDAYDTVEWLLKNVPGHNGRVGISGSSYPGYLAAMAAIDAHPAVRAVSPQAVMGDLFKGDDAHHNGALCLAHLASSVHAFGKMLHPANETKAPPLMRFPPLDSYFFYLQIGPLRDLGARVFGGGNEIWNEVMAHETYDAYWQARSLYPHLGAVRPAVLAVGGWYDAEDLAGTLQTYKSIEARNPGIRNSLVMGPWAHNGWKMSEGGSEDRGVFTFSGTRAYFQEKIELPFFNHYLKGQEPLDIPEAVVFETGTDQWRSFDSWPPAQAKAMKLFFTAHGKMSLAPAPDSTGSGFDEYVSDPAKPVPYTVQTTARYNKDYFVEDQRFAATRPDVLVYSGDVLSDDMTVSGPITAELFVSTTGTDADWVVKVIDVYPDDAPDPKNNSLGVRMGGYQRLVRGEIMRGKFRDSFEKPEPFVPGRVTRLRLELPDVQHTFRKGHRVMVQVQSSWFPLFDRNPQTFLNIRTATEEDFRKATQRLYHSRRYPSALSFLVLEKD
jgi:putative CocE/NonD family hydrolase